MPTHNLWQHLCNSCVLFSWKYSANTKKVAEQTKIPDFFFFNKQTNKNQQNIHVPDEFVNPILKIKYIVFLARLRWRQKRMQYYGNFCTEKQRSTFLFFSKLVLQKSTISVYSIKR